MKHLFLIGLFVSHTLSQAQETHFSQFYASAIYLNPALAGIQEGTQLSWNYRNQWPEISNSFITHSVSMDRQITKTKAGIGLNALRDRSGDGALSINSLGGVYSHQVKLSQRLFLRMGMRFSYVQKSVDWNSLIFEDMIDSRRGVIYNTQQKIGSNISFMDISAGMLLYNEVFYGGISIDHLSEPEGGLVNNNGNSKLLRRYTAHAGAKFQIGTGDNRNISPNALISKQADFTLVNVGAYIQSNAFVAGLWYGNNESLIILFGVDAGNFKIGYSYDIYTSAMTGSSLGSHELSYTHFFGKRERRKKYRTISCPAF